MQNRFKIFDGDFFSYNFLKQRFIKKHKRLEIKIVWFSIFIISMAWFLWNFDRTVIGKNLIGPTEFKLLKLALFYLLSSFYFLAVFQSQFKYFCKEIKNNLKFFLIKFLAFGRKKLMILLILTLIGFLLRLVFASTLPIGYDEAYTFLAFTKEGFLHSLIFYPAPNNHVFHSLLTNITYYFPFGQTLNLRLSSVIISTVTIPIGFYIFSKLLNNRIAFYTIGIFSCLPPVVYYGSNSRGYSLILFFYLIAFYATIRIIRNQKGAYAYKKYLFIFTGSTILGFYSIPSFLYPFIGLFSFLLFYSWIKGKIKQEISGYLFSGISIISLVVVLYSPIILTSGMDSLINNGFVSPIPRVQILADLVSHFKITLEYLFALNYIIIIIGILVIGTVLLYKKYYVSEVIIVLYIIGLSPILLIAHSVIPFSRTWIYMIVPVLYLIGLFLKYTMQTKWQRRIPLILFPVLAFFLLNKFLEDIPQSEKFSMAAVNTAEFLKDNKPRTILVDHTLVHINLKYLFEENKFDIPLFRGDNLNEREYDFLVRGSKGVTPGGFELAKNFDNELFVFQRCRVSM